MISSQQHFNFKSAVFKLLVSFKTKSKTPVANFSNQAFDHNEIKELPPIPHEETQMTNSSSDKKVRFGFYHSLFGNNGELH